MKQIQDIRDIRDEYLMSMVQAEDDRGRQSTRDFVARKNIIGSPREVVTPKIKVRSSPR